MENAQEKLKQIEESTVYKAELLILFATELVFSGKTIKVLWILLFIATAYLIGFIGAIYFTVLFAAAMIFIVMLFILVFGHIISNKSD